jgi:broad specificity phosphatase PhoE
MSVPVIYYIRHGETAWNAEGRFQGSQDIPLNALGRAQAVASGEILKGLLARGVMALPAAGYSIDDRLREIGYGRWEGLTLPEMEAHDPATFALRQVDKWTVAAPSGESYASVTLRMRQWFESLAGDTVTVAHGGTMRALMVALGVAPPLEAADTPIGQGVVYVFRDGTVTKFD